MSAIKDWLMDIESYVYEAIENGFTTIDDVVAYVNTYTMADASTVEAILEKFHEEPDFA